MKSIQLSSMVLRYIHNCSKDGSYLKSNQYALIRIAYIVFVFKTSYWLDTSRCTMLIAFFSIRATRNASSLRRNNSIYGFRNITLPVSVFKLFRSFAQLMFFDFLGTDRCSKTKYSWSIVTFIVMPVHQCCITIFSRRMMTFIENQQIDFMQC
jgi:hypothetical protein